MKSQQMQSLCVMQRCTKNMKYIATKKVFRNLICPGLRSVCYEFFRNYQEEDKKHNLICRKAYLNLIRANRLEKFCIIIQRKFWNKLERRRYLKKRHAVLVIQRFVRSFLAKSYSNWIK